MIEYRMLRETELVPELFLTFQRHQEITHCWRKRNDQWEVYPASRTIENWDGKQREFICWCLREILDRGGMAAGAFLDGALKGIISVEGEKFGSRNQYLAVPFLQISREIRGKGIGRQLFALAKAFAAEKGAEKLYISSNPAVETQAFYKAMGCVEAEEYCAEYVERNPNEVQIECSVNI